MQKMAKGFQMSKKFLEKSFPEVPPGTFAFEVMRASHGVSTRLSEKIWPLIVESIRRAVCEGELLALPNLC